MPSPRTTTFEVDVPKLRVFRKLDVQSLHPNIAEKLEVEEGRADYVDTDLARDFESTEEIMAFTVGAALVDNEGSILHEWDGEDGANKAARAMSSAKATYSFAFDTEDPEPLKKTTFAQSKPEVDETDDGA